MKKLILSLIVSMFSLVMYSQTYDVTISGIVTDEISGEAIPLQEMIITTDSIAGGGFMYFNTVFTDDYGYYVDIMQVPSGIEGVVEVMTIACNNMMSQSGTFADPPSPLTFDFQICGDSTGNECQAMFYYYPSDMPQTIQFVDDSWGDPSFWAWDFGDGETSDEQNPIHTYINNGDYIANLTITSQDSSCFSTFEMLVQVIDDTINPGDCQAFYYYYPGNDLNTINFIDESFGNPESWEWAFGDGSISNEQNPEHVYENQGEYVVSLSIVSDSGNCTSIFEDIVFVYNDSLPGDCQAMFFDFPDSTDFLTINFIDMSFVGTPTGIPDTWFWEFGDGTTSTLQNPTHTYITEGDYSVCLTISGQGNNDSCQSTECMIISVLDWGNSCYTWYEYQINDLNVDFQASIFEGGDNVEFIWDFGDGASGSGMNITHSYAESGMYEVLLTATNNDSLNPCVSTYYQILWVGNNISFDIFGYIFIEDSLMADYANVYLMTFDTTGNGLINVATTQVDSYGYYEFTEASLENCVYFVQAELTDQSSYFGDYVPTYHLDALNWEEAWPIFPFLVGWDNNVFMSLATSSNSGTGTITGTVSREGSRELLSNVEVLLLNQQGNTISYTRTNDEGVFSFENLAFDTYVVYTEIVGIETIPFDVTLNNQNSSSSVSVIVKNGQALLGIEDIPSAYIKSIEDIFPNPVNTNASLNITIKEASIIKIEVLNQYGQNLYETNVLLSTGKHEVIIPSASFAQGMYFVKITANDNISSVRKFIKLR